MNDLQQRRSRKSSREQTEVKQEISSTEENEDGSVKSITSPDHLSSQIVIKQEEISTSQAEEDSVHLNNVTSITCQLKVEPQSEEEEEICELENAAGDHPASYVIKREIIEVHTEDQHLMDDEVNHNKKTTRDEDSGTETNRVTKSENDNFIPIFPDDNIDEPKKISDPTKEMNKQQICEVTEMSHTQAKAHCQTEKSHECSVCAKVFQSSQACLQHMWNTHTGENPYTCEICGKSFKYLSHLQMHRVVHSDKRPFSCDACNKAFKRKRDLQSHKVSCHSDERPYSCDACNKAFKRKFALQRHKMFRHSNKRPYSCDMCKKTFNRYVPLHKSTVHSSSRSMPFK